MSVKKSYRVWAEYDAGAKVWVLDVEGVGLAQADGSKEVEEEAKDFIALVAGVEDAEVSIIWPVK